MLETSRPPDISDLEIQGPIKPGFQDILAPQALAFVADLARKFTARRDELLRFREDRQKRLDAGERPGFLPQTESIRTGHWQIAPTPPDLRDRRVEITGPVDRKMMINALNSGARVFLADLEDAHSPTWEGTVAGQINLRDAVDRTISFTSVEGKQYLLNPEVATLIVRPRGWHLPEKNVLLNGTPIPAALFDFGLYFFHNAKKLLDQGTGPYFYLPKLESHLEARLWNDIFERAEQSLAIPHGSTRVTVLIETILAAFEMDEILYELRDYITGLNCGRWDYIFSFIKRFHKHEDFVLPDRATVTMETHFLRSYSQLLIKTCHRRGAHAMGGMAAQIPIKDNDKANEAALAKVRVDKEREAQDGHDGTWVAHPDLIPVAMAIFDKHMPSSHQLDVLREEVQVTADDLLQVPEGPITEGGVRNNVSAALRYIAEWLQGNGCVPIHNLMEDAATAEIARAQLWQWIHHPAGTLKDGRRVTIEMLDEAIKDEMNLIRREIGEPAMENGHYATAAQLFRDLVVNDEFQEFLTLAAYQHLF